MERNGTDCIRISPKSRNLGEVYEPEVDVEILEEDVLKGTEGLLADSCRAPRLIYLEVHPYNWSLCGTTSHSLLGRLHAANYEVGTLDGEQCGRILTYGHII